MGIWSRLKEGVKKITSRKTTTTTTSTSQNYTPAPTQSNYTPAPNYQPAPTGNYTPAPTYVSGGGGGGSSGGGSSSPAPQTTGGQTLITGESVLVTPKGEVVGSADPTISRGSPIQPAPISSIQPYTYTGQAGERYQRPLGESLKASGRAALSVSTIGQQGIGAYTKSVLSPFEYTFKSKYQKESPININPTWRGTEIGYGLSDVEKERLTPVGYRSTKGKTYYEIGEGISREAFTKAGLGYSGESVQVIPQRVSESVSRNIKPKYEEELQDAVDKSAASYQERINTGEITLEQAETGFTRDVGLLSENVNIRYQQESKERYESRVGKVDFNRATTFQADITEPTIYKVARTGGRIVETVAIIGATTFGGSIPTIAASVYLGAKTQKDTAQYALTFGELSPKGRVLGAGVIALEGGAALYTGRLGVSKFYNEWRGIIYSDLARTKGTIRGREVLKTDDFTRYNVNTFRATGSGTSSTSQRIDIYPTGETRAGFFSKGQTTTRIFDPETSRYISSTQPFTTSGKIPLINPNVAYVKIGGTTFKNVEGLSGSYGQGFYKGGGNVREFNFISTAQDVGDRSLINTGRNVGNMRDLLAVRGISDASGAIYKNIETSGVRYIQTSGAKSSQQYFTNLYGGQAGALGSETQRVGLNTLASQTIKSSTIGAVGGTQAASQTAKSFSSAPIALQVQQPQRVSSPTTSVRLASLPTLSQLTPQKTRLGLGVVSRSAQASAPSPAQSVLPTTIQLAAPALVAAQISAFRLRGQTLQSFSAPTTSSFFNPLNPPPRRDRGFYVGIINGGLKLGGASKVLTGGRSQTGYTPSFSALAFNIGGSYKGGILRKSGIDFRPITKGFNFKTGLTGRTFLRRFRR